MTGINVSNPIKAGSGEWVRDEVNSPIEMLDSDIIPEFFASFFSFLSSCSACLKLLGVKTAFESHAVQ